MELLAQFSQFPLEAGIDEAGRGCLAGPVVAAAVILAPDFYHPDLHDSKKLTEAARDRLRPIICEQAIAWHVGIVDARRIDEINILNATYEAMHQAVDGLSQKPSFLSIDGNRFKAYPGINHACIIKGDGKYKHIAAASVLAKTFRDELMGMYHHNYPVYNWKQNKGYPTLAHKKTIAEHGPSPLHRKSFNWSIKKNPDQ